MAAPKVVAKGKNYLAARIRQRAIENQVPIIENPPLAQALYKSVDVGQEIPPHLYRAVAEILAYIFKLMNHGQEDRDDSSASGTGDGGCKSTLGIPKVSLQGAERIRRARRGAGHHRWR